MKKSDRLEHYKSLYFYEMDERNSFSARVQVASGIVFLLVSSFLYIIRMIERAGSIELLDGVIYTFFAVFILQTMGSAYYLKKAFWGSEYIALTPPLKMEEHYNKLVAHKESIEHFNEQVSEDEKIDELKVDEAFEDEVFKQLVESTTENFWANKQRSQSLHLAFKHIMLSSIPLIFSAFIFIGCDLDVSSPRKSFEVSSEQISKSIVDTDSPNRVMFSLRYNNEGK